MIELPDFHDPVSGMPVFRQLRSLGPAAQRHAIDPGVHVVAIGETPLL